MDIKFKQRKLFLNRPEKFLKFAFRNKPNLSIGILGVVIVGIILSPVIYQEILAIESLNTWDYIRENDQVVAVNKWILNNLAKPNIASNMPTESFLGTGLESVPIPPVDNQIEFEKYLDHFHISYLVFYDDGDYANTNIPNLFEPNSKNLYNVIEGWPTLNYSYSDVYSVNGSHVLKAINVMDADISTPALYVSKANLYEKEGNSNEALKIYNEIETSYPNNIKLGEQICDSLVQAEKYDLAIAKCTHLFQNDPTNKVANEGLIISYDKTGNRKEALSTIVNYEGSDLDLKSEMCNFLSQSKLWELTIMDCNSLLEKESNNTVALNNLAIAYDETGQRSKVLEILNNYKTILLANNDSSMITPFNNLLLLIYQHDTNLYNQFTTSVIDEAKNTENAGNMEGALPIYELLNSQLPVSKESFDGEIRILIKLGRYDDALATYDSAINYYEKQKRIVVNQDEQIILQKSIIDTMGRKAQLFMSMQRYDDAENVYYDIIRLDMFNEDAHLQLAKLLDRDGLHDQAKQEYDFAKRIEIANSKAK